ncbi:MAG: hypothetical protein ABIF77_10130 [bacterium]
MKKACFGVLLALFVMSTPVLAQTPTVGIYFDEAGTVPVLTGYNLFQPTTVITLHVVVFWENMVGGASFAIPELNDSRLALAGFTYADGLNIGDPWDGCGVEFGFSTPQFGFLGNPVHVMSINVMNIHTEPWEPVFQVLPHCNYTSVIVADRYSTLYDAEGLSGVIPNDFSTWGELKNLYR